MWKFKQTPFGMAEPLTVDSSNWSNLQKNPVAVIPYRIVVAAVVITVLLIPLAFFGMPAMRMIIGLWIGTAANLINFRGIAVSAEKYLEKAKMGMKGSMMGGFIFRQFLAGAALYLGSLLGGWSMLMAVAGLFLIKVVVSLDSFFHFKNR